VAVDSLAFAQLHEQRLGNGILVEIVVRVAREIDPVTRDNTCGPRSL
jgi:hypothetical protein